MMGSWAPGSRRYGGRAPSEARGIRPSRYRPDGPGTPRGGRLDRGRPAGPQDGPAGPPPVAAVSECEHRHRWSGTCARLARTVLPSIHTSMPICRRAWSTSRRHPVYTRHARTHSSGQSDFSGQEDPRGHRPDEVVMFMRHGWSGRARLSAGTHGHALSEASPGLEEEALKGCWAAHAHTGLVLWRSITGRPLGRGW